MSTFEFGPDWGWSIDESTVPGPEHCAEPGKIYNAMIELNDPSRAGWERQRARLFLIENRQLCHLPSKEELREKREREASATTRTDTAQLGKGNGPPDRRPAMGKAIFRTLSQVEARPYFWLWPGRIPIGEPVLFFGDCDQGKSMLTVSLAAIVTTGRCWPNLPGVAAEKGSVVFIQDEDSVEHTLKPRVEAAGGDPTKIHALDLIVYPDGAERLFSLGQHLRELEEGIAAFGDVRMLVIDPVAAYLNGVDEHSNAEVRGILKPLSLLSRKRRFATVMNQHVNKGSGTKAIYKVMGSVAWVNAPRCSYFVATDPDDSDRRLVACAKFNIGEKPPGLAYSFADMAIEWEAEEIDGLNANDILCRERAKLLRDELESDESLSKRQKAAKLILETLKRGPCLMTGLQDQALQHGIKGSTFRRALDELQGKGKNKKVVKFSLDGDWRAWLKLREESQGELPVTPPSEN